MEKLSGLGGSWVVGATAIAAAVGIGGYVLFAPDPPEGAPDVAVVAALPEPLVAPDATPPVAEDPARAAVAEPPASEEVVPEPAPLPIPGFDVVRVEVDGAALIAGTAPPGFTVEVLIDDEIMAATPADGSGAFVALFDLPPAEGARIVALVARGPEGEEVRSEDNVILAPRRAQVAAPDRVAFAETGAEPAQTRLAEGTAQAVAPTQNVAAARTAETGAQSAVTSTKARDLAETPGSVTAQQSAPSPSPAAASETAAPTETARAADAPVGVATGVAATLDAPQTTDTATATMTDEAAVAGPAPTAAAVSPTGPDRATASTEAALAPASTPAVSAPASTEVALAPAPASATPQPATTTAEDRARNVEAQTAVANTRADRAPAVLLAGRDGVRLLEPGRARQAQGNRVAIDVISYSDAGDVLLEGRSRKPPPFAPQVRVYLNNAPLQTVEIAEDGSWRTPLSKIDAGVYTLRVDQVAEDGTVVSRFETPFKREDPGALARLAPNQGPVDGVAASVITVQPGFTLWGIASDLYGDGLRYVQVFEANKELIRDPNLIYPGQVFEVPTP